MLPHQLLGLQPLVLFSRNPMGHHNQDVSLASQTLYRLRRGEGSGITPLPGFVLLHALLEARHIKFSVFFSFGLQQTPVCFHTPATGRATDLVGGRGGGGGLAFLQTTEQLVTLQQHDKKFVHILR